MLSLCWNLCKPTFPYIGTTFFRVKSSFWKPTCKNCLPSKRRRARFFSCVFFQRPNFTLNCFNSFLWFCSWNCVLKWSRFNLMWNFRGHLFENVTSSRLSNIRRGSREPWKESCHWTRDFFASTSFACNRKDILSRNWAPVGEEPCFFGGKRAVAQFLQYSGFRKWQLMLHRLHKYTQFVFLIFLAFFLFGVEIRLQQMQNLSYICALFDSSECHQRRLKAELHLCPASMDSLGRFEIQFISRI